MRSPWAFLLLSALVWTACSREPEWYPVPLQRTAPAAVAAPLAAFAEMSDPGSDAYLVRGFADYSPGDQWRWAFREPEMRFYLRSNKNLRFSIDFAAAEATFRETGPFRVSFRVNGQSLGTVRVTAPGSRHFEAPVYEHWLKENAFARVTLEPEKTWRGPGGAEHSVIVVRAGFRE